MKNPVPDFEQYLHYRPLPDTGAELNMREVYDLTSKAVRDFRWREAAADTLATVVRKRTESLGVGSLVVSQAARAHLKNLKEDGVVQLPDVLSAQQVADIHGYLEGEPILDFYTPVKKFDLENVPAGTSIGRYETDFNVNCPHIFEAFNHPSVLEVVEQFLGAPPTLSVVMLMWSFANEDAAQYMQLFHRDNDDFRFCKLFVYLTDVDDLSDGPHLFIKNSMSQETVSDKIAQLGLSAEEHDEMLAHVFAGHPYHRYEDKIVNAIFQDEDNCFLYGKAGSTYLENTWGIHRGFPPRRKNRLLLQAQYCLQPSPMFSYDPKIVRTPCQALAGTYNRYVNRMYVK